MKNLGKFTLKMYNNHSEALTGAKLAENKNRQNAVFYTTMHDLGMALQAEFKAIHEQTEKNNELLMSLYQRLDKIEPKKTLADAVPLKDAIKASYTAEELKEHEKRVSEATVDPGGAFGPPPEDPKPFLGTKI